jgi:ABC-type oligopeptide transport system ATPase subunit
MVLQLNNIQKSFRRPNGSPVKAVDGVSLSIAQGETVGLIGESGSGKSTIGKLALGLIAPDEGQIIFDGRYLNELTQYELRKVRADLQVVFQEPFESLSPRMRIGAILEEPLIIHRKLSKAERGAQVDAMLVRVGLDASFAGRYPRQLSGGQQQRVGIARALMTKPKMIILDEPTASLDLSVRALILNLLSELQREFGFSYLFISHDISSIRHLCSRIAVMYLGKIVESGPADRVIEHPEHDYTRMLMSATLSPDPNAARA